MSQPIFLIKEVVRMAWERFKENPWPWLGALLLVFIITATESILNGLFFQKAARIQEAIIYNDRGELIDELQRTTVPFSWAQLLTALGYRLVLAGFSAGFAYMALRAADGLKVKFEDLFARFDCFFNYFLSSLLYIGIVTIGLILFIVPGIIWAIRFGLYPFFIADQKAGPVEALKLSSKATYGFKWDLLKFLLLLILACIVGTLLFFVGLLVVLPVFTIAYAIIYRRLTSSESYLSMQKEKGL
ncbi:MAG: hypothetical protein H0V82_09020 [Candidatus Protochlamydia sp.]|nr:hypothetical protein [Candidatus Protochlamydia sp.]